MTYHFVNIALNKLEESLNEERFVKSLDVSLKYWYTAFIVMKVACLLFTS